MMHLKFDELLRLAEASTSQDGFDDVQIEQLEHLKNCRDCYESFCLLSALSDVMSESGSYVLDKAENVSRVNDTAKELRVKVLAKFQIIRSAATNMIENVFEQIDQATAPLQFGPSLAMATRGVEKNDTMAIRLEEFEDDKTYIVFKPDINEVVLQINVRGMDVENLKVYIVLEDMTKVEFPVTRRGNIVKGTVGNISDTKFQIVIEAE